MAMVSWDSLECLDDPFRVEPFALKCYISELYPLREIDRSDPRLA
jgi:hypothetical protein